jgi:predicted kinase
MKLNEILENQEIIIVCGNLCSGKGHFIKEHYSDYLNVSVSQIVKKLSGFDKRSDLTTTAKLDNEIIHHLIKEIDDNPKVIVDGIRQLSILFALEKHYGSKIKDVIWLDVPEKVRRERFSKRKAGKDDQDFEKATQGDLALGIDDVETHIRGHYNVVLY